jgi:hypothetical protein
MCDGVWTQEMHEVFKNFRAAQGKIVGGVCLHGTGCEDVVANGFTKLRAILYYI